MSRGAILVSCLLVSAPAVAQTYPFEGRWREGDNRCEDGLVLTATTIREGAANGGCRFTRVGRQSATTFSYSAQCRDDTGSYSTSGTIQMSGPDRFLMRDRLMQGQVTIYDRC